MLNLSLQRVADVWVMHHYNHRICQMFMILIKWWPCHLIYKDRTQSSRATNAIFVIILWLNLLHWIHTVLTNSVFSVYINSYRSTILAHTAGLNFLNHSRQKLTSSIKVELNQDTKKSMKTDLILLSSKVHLLVTK